MTRSTPTSTPTPTTPDEPTEPPRRWASFATGRSFPIIAVVAMVGLYVLVLPGFALTFIAAAWLIGTRVNPARTLLGLTLTEALAWAATIAIFEFLAALLLYLASANVAQ